MEMQSLSENLIRIRHGKRISQTDLAKKAGIGDGKSFPMLSLTKSLD